MINMKHLALGAYQTNCYLVWGEDASTCVVIDPGYEPDTVLATMWAVCGRSLRKSAALCICARRILPCLPR